MECERRPHMDGLSKKSYQEGPEYGNQLLMSTTDGLSTNIFDLSLKEKPRKTNDDFSVKRLKPEEKDAALKFLYRFFFRDEPLNQAVKLLENSNDRCLPLEEYALACIEDDVSFVAVDSTGEFVGILLNGITRKQEVSDLPERAENCPHKKFRKILKLLSHLEKETDLWEHLPGCDSFMEIKIATTHVDWRGRGLMKVLVDESESLARKMGITAMKMDATSKFSAAAAERLNYKKIYTVPYDILKDITTVTPAFPHTHASVYLKKI